MNIVTVILWLSVLLQVLAATMALFLIPLSGRKIVWSLFSVVFILMVLRRTISLLYEAGIIPNPQKLIDYMEPIALVISILLVIAIFLIRNIFIERNRDHENLEKQLDELQRFQKVTTHRELRMKELKEENAKLRAQLEDSLGKTKSRSS